MSNLVRYLPLFSQQKILVFGDLMLDEHIWSRVNRISPEAPVPVADVLRITHVPGGCGNVAANIASLGGTPWLVGMVGTDSSGEKLLTALENHQVNTRHLLINRKRPTILKSRIIAASQQLVRVDREERAPFSPEEIKLLIKKLQALITQVDGIIISDYGKGIVNRETAQLIIKLAKKNRLPVCVDPKGNDYAKYQGATVITPNLREAALAARQPITDEKSLVRAGRVLLQQVRCRYVLITRGKEGMSLLERESHTQIAAIPREVFDITGAGDSVIAALCLSLTAGATIREAATIANQAGSIVVGKVGTAACPREELILALEGREPVGKKIKTRTELAVIVKNLRQEGAKLVFTNGCFDLLHLGHVRYLREAKKLGDILILGLNSDASVTALKGKPRPFVAEMERAEILASLECVDYVTIFNELRPDNLIKLIKPHVHVKGGDYKAAALPERKLVESLGGKVIVIPPTSGRSTTNIVDRILGRK